MRIYLSGAMSGLPDLNFPAFHAEAARLRALGYDVVSPAEVNPDHTMSWEQCMRADIKALCDCDAIALMPGWENSKGAHLELHIAHRIGLRVYHCEALTGEYPQCSGDPASCPENEGRGCRFMSASVQRWRGNELAI